MRARGQQTGRDNQRLNFAICRIPNGQNLEESRAIIPEHPASEGYCPMGINSMRYLERCRTLSIELVFVGGRIGIMAPPCALGDFGANQVNLSEDDTIT